MYSALRDDKEVMSEPVFLRFNHSQAQQEARHKVDKGYSNDGFWREIKAAAAPPLRGGEPFKLYPVMAQQWR